MGLTFINRGPNRVEDEANGVEFTTEFTFHLTKRALYSLGVF